MWQDEFVKEYLKKVCELICPKGYSPDAVVKALWKGTDAMMANEQKKSNHDVFWEIFRQELGEKIDSLYEELLLFYQNEFDTVKKVVKEQRNCRLMIESLKKKGYRLALTTNPVFPSVAVRTRLSWIGLVPDDFEWVSDYENSDCCKPSLLYFEKALQYLGSRAESTLLVGNSVSEDLPASKLGIKTYFISDFSENPNGLPIVSDYQGKYEDFEKFVADLPPVRE
jgi:FMN phosphatase YigB (HAD superfamily)